MNMHVRIIYLEEKDDGFGLVLVWHSITDFAFNLDPANPLYKP